MTKLHPTPVVKPEKLEHAKISRLLRRYSPELRMSARLHMALQLFQQNLTDVVLICFGQNRPSAPVIASGISVKRGYKHVPISVNQYCNRDSKPIYIQH